ncbi:MAG: N-acetyltransferase [Gammaproteobacteria bacterium]|jgi:phosphinothricin acetyltransferase|nr:N-acetyltransferase [Gammaproteobacteria bacterium]MBT4491630.1 N-acetyltransferase [Gammaproteobacteria bacterium]MBT7369174.1 N-acetyltransferase [Gammaproteobacteria bacterium]
MNKDLVIRNAVLGDAEPLAAIYNYYVENTHITFDLDAVSIEDRREWLIQYNQNLPHRLLVAEENGNVIGYASSSRFRPKPAYHRSVETTIYLDPGHQGKGYGRMLYDHLLNELAKTNVNRCYGIIALPNDASVVLHRHLGFTEVGHLTEVGFKFEKYWDTLWMEKVMP